MTTSPVAPPRQDLSRQVIDCCLAMNARGINQGSAGNISVRFEDGFLITPSGMAYNRLQPEHIVFVDLQGNSQDALRPSSEWRMHRDIYANRAEAGAVLHAHSIFATALSCLRIDMPAFHYMIAVAGGNDIPLADYATFGTVELADAVASALNDRKACLMANHGQIACGENLGAALDLVREVEVLAAQYAAALQIDEPHILDDEEMNRVLKRFESYGQQEKG